MVNNIPGTRDEGHERDEGVVRALYESAFEPSVIADLVAPDVQYRLPDGGLADRRALVDASRRLRGAFSELSFSIEELTRTEEGFVVRWTMRGTHTGEFGGIAPTHARIEVGGRHVETVADGVVTARHGYTDHAALMDQLLGRTESHPTQEP